MPLYRVLYLKDEALERFRSQPPPEGPASLKPKDYKLVAEIEAPNEYAVWKMLQEDEAAGRNLRSMGVGDVLEAEPGRPRVCRFVGFDDAHWFTFEPKAKTPAPADEASSSPTEAPGQAVSETPPPENQTDPPPGPAPEAGLPAAKGKR